MEQAVQPTQATRAITPPFPGQYWPEQQGYYAGIVLGDDRVTAWHLIVPDAPEFSLKDVVWGERGQSVPGAMNRYDGHANTLAMAEAGSDLALKAIALPNGCYIPSRSETALCFATLADQFKTDDWYLTSTQYSEDYAWFQGFDDGTQSHYRKSYEARCRVVRRLAL